MLAMPGVQSAVAHSLKHAPQKLLDELAELAREEKATHDPAS